jgi:hypothetical protein
MPQLNWIEQFALTMAIALLGSLETRITNVAEKAALVAALAFLQSLLTAQMHKNFQVQDFAKVT